MACQSRYRGDVRLHQFIELLLVEVGEIASDADAGVVDQYVEIESVRGQQCIELGRRVALAHV